MTEGSVIKNERQNSLDHALKQRPTIHELVDKNILKDDSLDVAPALQVKKRELEKQMLEDNLKSKIVHRPDPEDLVNRGILKDQNVAPSLQEKQAALEKSMLEDNLQHKLAARPSPDELVEKGIMDRQEDPRT